MKRWFAGGRGLPPKWLLALDSHIAWGFGVPAFFGWVFKEPVLGAMIILIIDFLKEYFADPYFEGEPFIWDGVEDLGEYVIGVMLAYGLAYAIYHFLNIPIPLI